MYVHFFVSIQIKERFYKQRFFKELSVAKKLNRLHDKTLWQQCKRCIESFVRREYQRAHTKSDFCLQCLYWKAGYDSDFLIIILATFWAINISSAQAKTNASIAFLSWHQVKEAGKYPVIETATTKDLY